MATFAVDLLTKNDAANLLLVSLPPEWSKYLLTPNFL